MKNLFRSFLLLALVAFAACSASETPRSATSVEYKTRIVLMHPTVKNIKTLDYLISNGLFELPTPVSITGVYHQQGAHDYTISQQYIFENGLSHIRLLGVSPKPEEEPVFGKNSWSALFDSLFQNHTGILFMGGPDIPPSFYGQNTHLMTVIDDYRRHELELSFLFQLLGGYQDTLFVPLLASNPNFQILGICLGMQSMNVATGGTLVQDIPMQFYGHQTLEDVLAAPHENRHRNYHVHYDLDNDVEWGCFHPIRIEQGTFFAELTASETLPNVLSIHHQCIEKAGMNLRIAAFSLDGRVPEAVVHKQFPNVTGVQFHPEASFLYEPDHKHLLYKGQTDASSFIDLFPDEKGVFFHRTFWKVMAEKFSSKTEN